MFVLDEEDEIITDIIKRYRDGESSISISKSYGISPQTVLKWIRGSGERVRGKTEMATMRGDKEQKEARDAEIVRLYSEEYLSIQILSTRYRVSFRTIVRILEENGIERREAGYTLRLRTRSKINTSEALELYNSGCSLKVIADRYGVCIPTLRNHFIDAGILDDVANRNDRALDGDLFRPWNNINVK